MNKKYTIIVVVLVVAVVVALVYFFASGSGSSNEYTNGQPTTPTDTTGATTPGTAPTGTTATSTAGTPPAAQSFTVNGNDESADLTTITVPKGTPVTITFGADAVGTYHGGLDFRSSVINSGTIAPGATKSITFTANNSFAFTPYWPATNIAKPYKINIVVD